MKTVRVKPAEVKKEWLVVDAAGHTVGRLASEVARVLRGKHKPSFEPHVDCGDAVIVINAEKVNFTGNKWKDKVYYRHTKWVGGIKATRAEEMLAKHPERILETAIKGMLPKTTLGRHMAKSLRVYVGAEHGQQAQNPKPFPKRLNTTAK